jgi:hypothetical protein
VCTLVHHTLLWTPPQRLFRMLCVEHLLSSNVGCARATHPPTHKHKHTHTHTQIQAQTQTHTQ